MTFLLDHTGNSLYYWTIGLCLLLFFVAIDVAGDLTERLCKERRRGVQSLGHLAYIHLCVIYAERNLCFWSNCTIQHIVLYISLLGVVIFNQPIALSPPVWLF